jgi:hypothetical protein
MRLLPLMILLVPHKQCWSFWNNRNSSKHDSGD